MGVTPTISFFRKNGGPPYIAMFEKWVPLFLSEYPLFSESPEISGFRSFSYFCVLTLLTWLYQ